MPLGYVSPVLSPPRYEVQRRAFISAIEGIIGKTNIKAGYLPHRYDSLTSVDPWTGRVWTAETNMQGRLSQQGKGTALSFNGSSNFLTTPDQADQSFGNGTTDNAGGFGLFVVANATANAANRTFLAKNDGVANQEYKFSIASNGKLDTRITDQSLAATPEAVTTSAITTEGLMTAYGLNYSAATGGALAASDMTFYINGAVQAPTAVQAATYIAMEGLAASLDIGAIASTQFFAGSIAVVVLVAGMTAAMQTQLSAFSRAFLRF